MNKDCEDFEPNFLKELRISVQGDRKNSIKQQQLKARRYPTTKVREKVDSMIQQVVKRKLSGQWAQNTLQNWIPVWPQLDSGYGEHFTQEDITTPSIIDCDPVYSEIDISSLRRWAGNRKMLR